MDDRIRIIVFFLTFLPAVTCGIVSTFVLTAMIGEINRKSPDNAQIGYFGFWAGKFFRIKDEYMRLYPSGKLLILLNALRICGILLFISSAAVLFRFIK